MSYNDSYSVSPEDFLEALGSMDEKELQICKSHSIFTIRQLACADPDFVWNFESNRFHRLVVCAREIVANFSNKPATKKTKTDICWGYTYVSPAIHQQIQCDRVLKSPYELFQAYAANPHGYTCVQPWKAVYYEHMEAAGARMKSTETPTDADVFAYLIWRGHRAVSKCDVTAAARAIPFLIQWLPGHIHGSSLAVDKVNAHETGNPYIAERYAYPVALNLTSLCENHKASLYSIRQFSENKLDLYNWEKMNNLSDFLAVWKEEALDNFNPGQNIFDTIPHGTIVIPSGEIPIECLKLYPRSEPVERVISF